MNRGELLTLVALGEDSWRQFKANITNADSLAADLVAFSNSSGGVVLIGIADNGTLPGLTSADVRRLNQLIVNATTQHMRSPISPKTENVPLGRGRVIIVVTVAEGLDKQIRKLQQEGRFRRVGPRKSWRWETLGDGK